MPRPANEEHLGILGPLIRAVPGERITVYFKNNVNFGVGLQPSGLLPLPRLTPAADGSNATTANWDAERALAFASAAAPGATVVYEWIVPPEAAPAADEPDTKLWLYRSALYSDGSDNAGLLGPILVGRSGGAVGGAPPPSGRDIVTVMHVMHEDASPYADANLAGRDAAKLKLADEEQLAESLGKRAINGFIYCNVPQLEMTQGER